MRTNNEHTTIGNCTSCGGVCVPLSVHMALIEKHQSMLERIVELELTSWEDLSEVQKDRLTAIQYLRKHHGGIKVTPRSLHTLSPHLQQECRDYLYTVFGNDPRAQSRIKEVFKKPKKRTRQSEHEYSLSYQQYGENSDE